MAFLLQEIPLSSTYIMAVIYQGTGSNDIKTSLLNMFIYRLLPHNPTNQGVKTRGEWLMNWASQGLRCLRGLPAGLCYGL